MDGHRDPIAGLQYAATAFYAVAVVHGLWLHGRDGGKDGESDARSRAWTPAYATGMLVAFLVGSRRTGSRRMGDRARRVRVTVLLVLFYGSLRAVAAVPGSFEGENRYRRGAAAEGAALLLAYALAAALGPGDGS